MLLLSLREIFQKREMGKTKKQTKTKSQQQKIHVWTRLPLCNYLRLMLLLSLREIFQKRETGITPKKNQQQQIHVWTGPTFLQLTQVDAIAFT